MTGNTKIWRAPLAGLASVAMIATMGMAAATANAAGVDLKFYVGDDVVYTYKDEDGTITAQDLQREVGNANTEVSLERGTVLTGWYTAPTVGDGVAAASVWTAQDGRFDVDPAGTTATALYAHTDTDPYTVVFDRTVVNGGIGGTRLAYNDKTDKLDVLTAWQIPSADVQGDSKVVYDKNGHYAVSGDATAHWKSSFSEAAVDPTKDLLAEEAFNTSASGTVEHNTTLAAVPVQAAALGFNNTDAWTGAANNTYTLYKSDGITGYGSVWFDVAVGAKLGDYVDFPRAKNSAGEASAWKAKQADQKDVVAKYPSYTADSLMPANQMKLYPTDANAKTFVTLHYNDKTAETTKLTSVDAGQTYAVPAGLDDVKAGDVTYSFVGWYSDNNTFKHEYTVASDVPPANLYAKWEVASVEYTFDPVYTDPVTVTVENGKQITLPTFDRGEDWTLTGWTPSTPADKVNLYMSCDHTAYGTATVQYKGAGTQNLTDYAPVGTKFTATWTKSTDLPALLSKMEKYVTVSSNGKYIKGSDQVDFTAESYDAYVSFLQDYWKNKTTPQTVADYRVLVEKLSQAQAKLVEVADAPLYRMYNKNNGDHYMTIRKKEADALQKLGWTAEGAKFNTVKTRGNISVAKGHVTDHNFGSAVYSVYNPNTGEHLLTASTVEAKALKRAGWQWDNGEKAVFYTVQGGSASMYRVYNPNTNGPAHHYAGLTEATILVGKGWKWDYNASPVFTLN